MGKRDASRTGANTEPMPFVRKFGAGGSEAENYGASEESKMKMEVSSPPSSFDRPRRSSYSRSRSRSPLHKKKHKKRSRSKETRKERRHRDRSPRSHSRDRSRDRDRKRRKRSRSSSRSPPPRRSDSDRDRDSRDTNQKSPSIMAPPPQRTAPAFPNPLAEVTASLPPHLRGQIVAQSLLVKPEALPDVINAAVKNSAAAGPGILDPNAPKERVRKSRWSNTKSFVPGMPTILPSNLDDAQRQGYLLQLEIEEATRKLRLGDFSQPDGVDRSPSPEPVYDANGKRLNTRDVRKRQELEQLRHEKIQALLKINPAYKPPADYRAPNIRLHDKVWIPQEAHPEINFVGLLIGPRGNTLKALEAETQAKIIIRGKGSVKEGKLGRREGPLPGENEPLHAYITGPDKATIQRACSRITEIINAALMIPDGQNELRKLQLRELAVLNGTLRPEDILNSARCSNCGSDLHKTWECPEAANVTANIICSICGGGGHLARDCKSLRGGEIPIQTFDDEYASLMDVLGEKPTQGGVPGMPGVAQFGTFRQQQIQQQFAPGEDGEGVEGGEGFQPKFFQNRPTRNPYKPPDSGSLPPPPAFLTAWKSESSNFDYGDMSSYYSSAGYGAMDPSTASNWLAPPPPPPPDTVVAPVPPVTTEFTLAAPPPPPSMS